MKFQVFSNRIGWLRRHAGVLVVLFSISAGVVAGPLITRSVSAAMNATGRSDASQIAIPTPVQLSSEFSKITKLVAPAVVNINTESTVKTGFRMRQRPGEEQNPFGGQSPLEDFFNQFGGPSDMPQNFKQKSLGSGVIVDKDGYILPNHHVVGEADKIQVKIHGDPKA